MTLSEKKIRLAEEFGAAAENWKKIFKELPSVPEISIEEIVDEIKVVRKIRHQ